VEQKNFVVVRRLVGYDRYCTKEAYLQMQQLYQLVSLYTNFFQPVAKLLVKTRVGSRVHKQYEPAKTPYQRLLAWEGLDPSASQRLAVEATAANKKIVEQERQAHLRREAKVKATPRISAS
jgi:hypothetical protein